MMMEFGIQVEDGSEQTDKFAIDENIKSVTLYDWQREAIDFFMKHNEVIYEIVTGGGKTFCAIEIIKNLIKKEPKLNVLIVVPKNIILEDTWFRELYNNGFSMVDVGVYYGAVKEYGRRFTITNMQNIQNVVLELFNCVVFDEIHNFGTKRLLPYVNYPFKYKIGLSATVDRMDNKHWEIIKMFNYNVFKYTPKQALNDGVLNPFDFINVGIEVDDETYEKYIKLTQELNTILQTGGGFGRIMRMNSGLKFKMLAKMNERKQLVNNYERKFDVIRKICSQHKDDKIIIFNQFNQQTNKCYWHLLEDGIKARVMHSGIEKSKRSQDLMDYRNDKFNVLLTSKVLDEGWNLPSVDCAIIMAGDSTARQTIQRMGRVLRRKTKNSTLYQIYCRRTIEEDYACSRAKLFEELCSNYEQYIFNGVDLIG